MMVAVLITITMLKAVLAACWGGTADIPQTLEQARSFLAREDVLDPAATNGNPSFFPLGHYLIASACLLVSQDLELPFTWTIKMPAILADAGLAWLLKIMPRGGDRVALLYLLSPVTLLLSVYHGQLHTVAMASAMLSYWLADRAWPMRSGIMLGLAASVRQHFTVLLLPLTMRPGVGRWVLASMFAVTVALVNSPLLASAHPGHLAAPTWTYGSWGYTLLLQQGPRVLELAGWSSAVSIVEAINRAVQGYGSWLYGAWVMLFAAWIWRRRPADQWSTALVYLLGLYAVSPGFGVQWLVWVVPFWLLVNQRGAVIYSALAGAFLAGSYWQWGLNTKYAVRSITANLQLLSHWDLIGVMMVGGLGVLTWAYTVWAAWHVARHQRVT